MTGLVAAVMGDRFAAVNPEWKWARWVPIQAHTSGPVARGNSVRRQVDMPLGRPRGVQGTTDVHLENKKSGWAERCTEVH